MAEYDTLTLTAEIVASYLSGEHHRVTPAELPDLIRSVRAALTETSHAPAPGLTSESDAPKPSRREITKSISPDALISFMDGKPYKTLKRHLSRHGLDMPSYRERFGLPVDYPSVVPNYSAARSAIAKSLGLGAGRKARAKGPVIAKASPPTRKASTSET